MSDYTPAAERTIYTGNCCNEDCQASMAIWPHWERETDLPERDEWEAFLDCPVCGDPVDIDFKDPMQEEIKTGYRF